MKKSFSFTKTFVLTITVLALLLGCTSCFSVKKEYYVTWKDADGTLLEYATVGSDYNPTFKDLPEDTDEWQYIEWDVKRIENRIECTAVRLKKSKIQWLDADGSILREERIVISDESEISFPLPKDSDQWHYTEWVKSVTSDGFVFLAKRVPKEKHVWRDTDGSLLKEEFIAGGNEVPTVDLPPDNEKWKYVEWDTSTENETHVYTAKRTPNSTYFVGNVFQIVIKDTKGEPLGTGSGFVLNDDGWFITNNHVMEKGTSAIAFFDIADSESGGRYTQLNILGGVFNSEDKDIFIGKLEGYEKIKDHYNDIQFTEEYTEGEASYTIGYPNSSVKMEINSGVILEEYSDIYDKINGVYYVLSDSYIAPGSSGGILVNEEFKVIGITSIGFYADSGKQVYINGGSVPTFVFASHLEDLDESEIKKITDIY